MKQPATPKPVRIYTSRRIGVIAFIGGPLAAAWAISRNWKAMGDDEKAERSLLVGAVSTLAIIIVLFLLSKETVDHIPSQFLPAVYTALSVMYFQQNQKKEIGKILSKGGKKFSFLNCLKVAIGATIVTILFALPFIFFS